MTQMTDKSLQKALSSLVDAARHILNVLGFVLQAAVVVVGLHTRFDFTADGRTQLGAQCALLEKQSQQNIPSISQLVS